MINFSTIQAIAFDAYGTLFDIASIDARLAYYYGEKAPALAALWRRKQLEYTWLRTLMGRYASFISLTGEALRYAAEQLELPLDAETAGDLIKHYHRLAVFPETRQALDRLQLHFPLSILTNADEDLLASAVAFNEIGRYFQHLFNAEAVGMFKPVAAVYLQPVQKLQLTPGAVLFASSNAWDVAGAKSAGLAAAWVRRRPAPAEQLGFSPDLIVNDLSELADRCLQ